MTKYQPQNIKIADFDYTLPDERIAKHPLTIRDACKLLVSNPDGSVGDFSFRQLPELLGTEGMVVFNNTRVIHARIPFRRPTGAAIEIFLLEPLQPEDYVLVFQSHSQCDWSCMVGNLKKWKEESLSRQITLPDGTSVTLTAKLGEPTGGNARRISFTWDNPEVTFASVVEAAGRIPIPPYLKRESELSDEDDYQTVYSKFKGSVAAPTAGLHFTAELLNEMKRNGLDLREVTLHVGAGTFQPVKCPEIGEHPMHTEVFSVQADFLRALARIVEADITGVFNETPIVTAVGTTSVRTLESLPYIGRNILQAKKVDKTPGPEDLHLSQWECYQNSVKRSDVPEYLRALAEFAEENGGTVQASTAIMIAPGFSWNIVNRMVTNFHQPASTLLLLISAFMQPQRRPDDGGDTLQWRVAYNHALNSDYRFLSYGDACLLYPRLCRKD